MSTFEPEGFDILELDRDRFAHVKLVLGGEDIEQRELSGFNVTWEDRYGPVYE
jgi:hypothetical protein